MFGSRARLSGRIDTSAVHENHISSSTGGKGEAARDELPKGPDSCPS